MRNHESINISHSPPFISEQLDHFFEKFPAIKEQSSFAVAVSGGPDSMALLHALSVYASRENKKIFCITVDHGLRDAAKKEAEDVAQWVAAQNTAYGNDLLNHVILKWDEKKQDAALMEAARQARYQLMADYCTEHNIQNIFVAHHQDDQAETFLIRLSKGSGLDGLACMDIVHSYNKSINIIRPFLNIPKQDLVSYCQEHDVPFAQDPSNENEKYLRPRLRGSMNVLAQEGLSAKRLTTLTRRLRRARQALSDIADKEYNNVVMNINDQAVLLNFSQLKQLPEEIALRIIQKSVREFRQGSVYDVRMDRLEDLFESLWFETDNFKPRTLGGLIFALKDKNSALYISKEL